MNLILIYQLLLLLVTCVYFTSSPTIPKTPTLNPSPIVSNIDTSEIAFENFDNTDLKEKWEEFK